MKKLKPSRLSLQEKDENSLSRAPKVGKCLEVRNGQFLKKNQPHDPHPPLDPQEDMRIRTPDSFLENRFDTARNAQCFINLLSKNTIDLSKRQKQSEGRMRVVDQPLIRVTEHRPYEGLLCNMKLHVKFRSIAKTPCHYMYFLQLLYEHIELLIQTMIYVLKY